MTPEEDAMMMLLVSGSSQSLIRMLHETGPS